MGIKVQNVGNKAVDTIQKETAATAQKPLSDESIFAKNKEKTISTSDVLSIAGGILLGIAAAKFLPKILKKSPTDSLRKAIQKTIDGAEKRGSIVSISEMRAASARTEEQAFYESILKDFDELNPAKPSKINIGEAKSFVKKHISGFESKYTTYKGKTTMLTYEKDTHNHLLYRPEFSQYYGEGPLVEEFEIFLNGAAPSEQKFAEFIHNKEISFVKEHWQDLYFKNFEKESLKEAQDKAIKEAEGLYHRRRKNEFERLWHPYPTKRFYRIVDKNELSKMLRGEEIISRNRVNGYDRIDISSDPYYERISRLGKFRIEFRGVNYDGSGNADLARRIRILKEEYQHYQIHGSYSRADVLLDRIKAWNGDDWVPVRLV